MKVLLIIDNLGTGGAQRQIINLAIGLRKKDIETHVFTYHQINIINKRLNDFGIIHHQTSKKNKWSLKPIKEIVSLQKENKYSSICAFLYTPSFYLLCSTFFMKLKPRIIVSERTFEDNVNWFHKNITRLFYYRANKIIVNSNHQLEILHEKLPSIRDKIILIHNGVDTSFFTRVERSNWDAQEINIIAVGRVSTKKDTMTLILATDYLINLLRRKLHVYWVGAKEEFFDIENEYANECFREIKTRKLEEFWSWVGQTETIEKYYQLSDILVHPSLGEGFPNAICEALACGLPVIASNVFDHSKIILEEYNGYVFRTKDFKDLVNKIEKFISLIPDERKQMSDNAVKTAKNTFSLKVNIESFINILK